MFTGLPSGTGNSCRMAADSKTSRGAYAIADAQSHLGNGHQIMRIFSVFPAIFTMLLTVNSCSTVNREVLLEPTTPYITVTEDCILEVSLPANPTTGYQWQLEVPENIITVLSEEYTPNQPVMIGSGGVYCCKLKTIAGGNGTLTARYMRPWENFDPDNGREYHWDITVTGN